MNDVTMVKGLTERNLLVMAACVFLLGTSAAVHENVASSSSSQILRKRLDLQFPCWAASSAANQHLSRCTRSLCCLTPRTGTKGRDAHRLLMRAVDPQGRRSRP
ncbi:hypothetical protein CCMA1212_003779 [Trichoderma ghanense]|uniref:SSCRP protein n=1 Tax=Trichoderma ghanense TaxID=65468 RepID=A0ABY2H8G4_9HYPO